MSEFDNDLYGDLDLEDLDATQLDEELVDPDQDKHDDNKDLSAPLDAPVKHEPAPAPNDSHASGSGREHGGNDGYFENRMRPSDMPDEGLVLCSSASCRGADAGVAVARLGGFGCGIRALSLPRVTAKRCPVDWPWPSRRANATWWRQRLYCDSYSCRLPGRPQTTATQLDRTDIVLALPLHSSRKTSKHIILIQIPMSSSCKPTINSRDHPSTVHRPHTVTARCSSVDLTGRQQMVSLIVFLCVSVLSLQTHIHRKQTRSSSRKDAGLD